MDSQIGSKMTPRLHPTESDQVEKTRPREDLKLYHHSGPFKFPIAAVEELNLEERVRGEFIHRVLYFVDTLDENIEHDLEGIIERVNDEFKLDYPVETAKKNLLEFLNHEEIRRYFRTMPGGIIRKEQEFSDSRGNLLRMDRVIFEKDQVSVIDYKTGTNKEAEKEYISQLKNYIRILKEIYPGKNIEGVIAYVDLNEIKKVK
jgi:ATP-dependent exoDNAse (exonuclease V) beta subunit